MKKYTFIAEYKGGTYISQYTTQTIMDALHLWVDKLDVKIFSKNKRDKILSEINDPEQIPVQLKEIEKVWCCCYLSGKSFLLLNIVETA